MDELYSWLELLIFDYFTGVLLSCGGVYAKVAAKTIAYIANVPPPNNFTTSQITVAVYYSHILTHAAVEKIKFWFYACTAKVNVTEVILLGTSNKLAIIGTAAIIKPPNIDTIGGVSTRFSNNFI